jgi:hypothetical protein
LAPEEILNVKFLILNKRDFVLAFSIQNLAFLQGLDGKVEGLKENFGH